MLRIFVGACVLCASIACLSAEPPAPLAPVRAEPKPTGSPIVTLRYFRIKKGSFPTFLRASEEGVWPFFEKIGARPLGMWQVIDPDDVGPTSASASQTYDEVWLATGYASVAHWRATREMAALGGTGDDYRKAMEALRVRQELTLQTDVTFMQGTTWTHPPLFTPTTK